MYNPITLSESYAIAHVECVHPDYSSAYHEFNISVDYSYYEYVENFKVYDDTHAMLNDIRTAIENKVNPSGYWHEVIIKLSFIWNGKILDTVEI